MTTTTLDAADERPLLVIVDTNVVLHCKPLAELPWEQFGVAQVDVLLVDPVVVELDTWKGKGNDARAKRVRSMLPLLRQMLEAEDLSITVTRAKCTVRLRMPVATLSDSRSTADADGQIVAAAEKVAAEENAAVVVVTRDVVMALRAHRRGVPYRLIAPEDADWHTKPEAVDADHAETVRKLREYERQRPELSAEASGSGLEVNESTITALVPIVRNKFNVTSAVTDWAADEFSKPRWKKRDADDDYWSRQLKRLDHDLVMLIVKRLHFGPIVKLAIRNTGSVNAEDVQVEVMTEGNWRVRSDLLDLRVDVPPPPREDRFDSVGLQNFNFPNTPLAHRRREDEPEWTEKEKDMLQGASKLVAHIPVLRHRSEVHLLFHVGPAPDGEAADKLIVRISSARQPSFELITWRLARSAPEWSKEELVQQLVAGGELSFRVEKE